MHHPQRRLNRTHVPVGLVTRFSKPVDVEELQQRPPTPKGRRRALSYVNSAAANERNSPTFEEWLKMLRTDTKEDASATNMQLGVTPVVGSSPTKIVKNDSSSDNAEPHKIYDAILFATDTDYLESSQTRAIFRQNAVTSEDVKLFEMPEYTGSADVPPSVTIVDDSPLCEWCYPPSSGEAER